MVSALWKAAVDGDIEKVQELLKEASSVDVEIKDHTGATPLIQAIRNGHVDVVKELLDHGADPNNSSAQGRPESYTENGEILEQLASARAKMEAIATPPPAMNGGYSGYGTEQAGYQAYQGYYGENMMQQAYPPYPYMYHLDMVAPPAPLPQQQPQSPQQGEHEGHNTNLPPPSVARTIPCRYYPACRYGSSCMFLHPDPNPAPTYSYPMQTVPYPYATPPYDPSTMPYPPGAYYMPPPGVGYAMPPISSPPYPPNGHHRSSSDIHSPVSVPFSPVTNPVISPIASQIITGYSTPMSPPYAQPQAVQQPISPIDASHGAQSPPGHSPTSYYAPNGDAGPPTAPAAHRRSYSTSTRTSNYGQASFDDSNGIPEGEPFGPSTYFRGSGRGRGGKRNPWIPGRHISNVPCMFFPTGKCKNGDACRFAHVMPGPDDPPPPPTGPRGHRYRSSYGYADHPHPHQAPSFPSIAEPLDGAQSDGTARQPYSRSPVRVNGETTNQAAGVDRLRAEKGGRPGAQTSANGSSRASSVAPSVSRQRVPSAEDFPALQGSFVPAHGYTHKPSNGPTAAQVLQAPPRNPSIYRTESGSSTSQMPVQTAKPTQEDVQELVSKLEAATITDAGHIGLPTTIGIAPAMAVEAQVITA